MKNSLPDQYVLDLFHFISDGQPLIAQYNGVEYSEENAYKTGIEIATIGLMFAARRNDRTSTPDKDKLMNDLWERFQFWEEKTKALASEEEKKPEEHQCDDDKCGTLH